MKLARLCKDCRAIDECVKRYGKFWSDRSRNGLGCPTPLDEPNTPPADLVQLSLFPAEPPPHR